MSRTESTEQILFVNRVRQLHPGLIIFAIPNGGKRNPIEASRLKREGVLAGVPDLFIAKAKDKSHGLFIEMKKAEAGRVSEAQSKVHGALRTAGYDVLVCHGVEEAWSAFKAYLARKDNE
jgi:hypothetical protein